MQCTLSNRDETLPDFEIKTESNAESVRSALGKTAAWLSAHNIVDADAGNVEIVLAEALNNIVEHAQMLPDEMIAISIALSDDHLLCTIRDTGIHSDVLVKSPSLATSTPDDIGALPEGGFGISLIQAITSNIEYFPVLQGNLVALTVPLTTNPVQI